MWRQKEVSCLSGTELLKLLGQIMWHGAVHGAETSPDTRTRLHSNTVVRSPCFTAMINCPLCSCAYHQFHSYYWICQHQGLIIHSVNGSRHHERCYTSPTCTLLFSFFGGCLIYVFMYSVVVMCGGEKASIFSFLNDLVSNRQHELPGEQLVCILIRPSNHLSEAVTAFLILLLTGSVSLLLWISHIYICSRCIKCLYERGQTSMEDIQNTLCVGPRWLWHCLPA